MLSRAKCVILVSEDDPDEAFLVKNALAEVAPDALLVYTLDGRHTLEFLQRRQTPNVPALLLLDLKMPRLSGFDVLRWLRHNPANRPLAIAVLSSSRFDQDMDEARKLGADYYLVKPLAYPELKQLMNSLVQVVRGIDWPAPSDMRNPNLFQLRSGMQ